MSTLTYHNPEYWQFGAAYASASVGWIVLDAMANPLNSRQTSGVVNFGGGAFDITAVYDSTLGAVALRVDTGIDSTAPGYRQITAPLTTAYITGGSSQTGTGTLVSNLGLADQQNADQQNADQGGAGGSGGGTIPVTPPSTGTGGLVYCTLPLQIALANEGLQPVTRIDWYQFALGPQLQLGLIDGTGYAINLTGAISVTLRLAPIFGGVVISEAMTILYAAGGIVAYTFQASDVAIAGTYNLQVEAIMSDGSPMFFSLVLFVINPSLGGP